ncbi:MoxR family ATPase [bacterium]|nr:MAG: MoxR family ATPase [bacterium]
MRTILKPLLWCAPLALATLGGCTRDGKFQPVDMWNGARLKPYEQINFFDDKRSSRVPPAGTVARGQDRLNEGLYYGTKNGALIPANPLFAAASSKDKMALLERVHAGFNAHDLTQVGVRAIANPDELMAARRAVQGVKVSDGMIRYIFSIVERTRNLATLTLGASPRAGIALLECAKALAAMNGRDYIIPEDVKTVAPPVLRHRLLLRAESEMEGLKSDDIIRSILGAVEVPR